MQVLIFPLSLYYNYQLFHKNKLLVYQYPILLNHENVHIVFPQKINKIVFLFLFQI